MAQTLTPADAEFLVSITGADGVRQTVHSSVVPLLPERACYEWRIRIGSDEKLVKATEVFTLPGAPKQWGGVDENSYSASQLSGDRTVAETTLFFSPTDGWISNGWCVADGDPVGQYSIKVHVGDRMVHEFSFTVENVLAPQP